MFRKSENSRTNNINSRRKFLGYILSGSLTGFIAAIVYPVIKFLKPPVIPEAKPSTILGGELNELKNNSGKIFRFGNEPGILIKTPDGEIRAFTAVCTHLACTVQYREDLEHIWCACHDGHYNLSGINLKGPPPRPLQPFKVNVKEDKIYVSRI